MMARLTEEMVIARSKQSDLSAIKKLNCWGAELGDVSLVRRMPNVEVLALSINKIRTLGDFAGCRRLRELYIRKNEIRDLREIRHLRPLPDLTSLWLDENPCTHHPEYRLTVLRNLPNLEKLDNVPVHPEEVSEAMRRGAHIADSDDEGYPQTEAYGEYRGAGGGARARSEDSSPERASEAEPYAHTSTPTGARPPLDQRSDSSEGGGGGGGGGGWEEPPAESPHQGPLSPGRRGGGGGGGGAEPDERYEHPAMTRSHYHARSPEASAAALRHSLSAHCVKEYAYGSNGECRHGSAGAGAGGAEPYEPYYERAPERCEQYPPRGAAEWERDSTREREREREREYPSAVMAEHRGFTRRPAARNSNLLSAVLCLVKELDYPSLEVADMAVRCRMDELANAQ